MGCSFNWTGCGSTKPSIVVRIHYGLPRFLCPRGGIGRRAGLRNQWGNPWEFESLRGHQVCACGGMAYAAVLKTATPLSVRVRLPRRAPISEHVGLAWSTTRRKPFVVGAKIRTSRQVESRLSAKQRCACSIHASCSKFVPSRGKRRPERDGSSGFCWVMSGHTRV